MIETFFDRVGFVDRDELLRNPPEGFWGQSNDAIEKAYKRKYATRAEAARAAANARWGNRTPKPTASKDVNWQQLKSIDEINAAWNDKHGALVPGDFTGVSVRFARQAAGGLDTMFQQYPDVAAGLSFVGGTSSPLYRPTVQEKLGLSDAETTKLLGQLPYGCFGGTSMKYGFIAFSEDSDNTIQNAFNQNQASGWIVPTRLRVTPGEYIAVHEFGHAVARHMGIQSAGYDTWKTSTQDVLDRGTSGAWKKTEPLVTEVNEFGRRTTGSKNISKALSEYGAADPDEAFAESWAEIHLSDSPRPYAINWVKGFSEGIGVPVPTSTITKAYKRKYATREEAARAAANARWGNRTPKVDAPVEPAGPVVEPWVDQKTAAAVDKEFNRRWGQRTLMKTSGLSPEAANGVGEAMNELLTIYPDTTLHLVGTQTGISQMIRSGTYPPGTPESVRSLASRGRYPKMQQSEGGDYTPQLQFIRINKNNHSSDGYGSISTQLSEEAGWFTPTGASGIRHAAKRSMVHEFGHAIDFDPKKNPPLSGLSDPNNPISKATRQATGVEPTAALLKSFIEASVGTYASSSPRELFAETFTEYHMNPAARPLSVDFVKFRMGELGVPLAAPSTLSGSVKKFVSSKRSAAGRKAAEARWGKNMKKFPKALGRMTPRQRASLMLSADKPAKVKFVGPEGRVEEVQRDNAGNIVTERMSPSTEYRRRLYGSDSWVQTGKGPVLGPKVERKKKKKLQAANVLKMDQMRSTYWKLVTELAAMGIKTTPVEKAANRSEAGRIAAQARWAGHTKKKTPVSQPTEKPIFSREEHAIAVALVERVAIHEPALTEQMKDFAEEFGGEMSGLQNRLKKSGSLARKIHMDAIEKSLSPEAAAAQIKDAVRYTMVLPDSNYGLSGQAIIDRLRAEGNDVKVKNTWSPDSEYKGINLQVFEKKKGFWFELQLHTAQSLATKNETHKIYELERVETNPVKKRLYQEEMKMASSRLPIPTRAEIIKSKEGGMKEIWWKRVSDDGETVYSVWHAHGSKSMMEKNYAGGWVDASEQYFTPFEDADFIEISKDEVEAVLKDLTA